METRASLQPSTIDRLILAGLRLSRGPVDAGDVARVCHLEYGTTSTERQQSLDRLVSGGLVARSARKTPHPRRPLLDSIQTTTYRAIGGDR